MKRGEFIMAAAVTLFTAAGCSSARGPGFFGPNDNIPGRAVRMSITEKRISVAEIVEKMLTDPVFRDRYGEAKSRAASSGRAMPSLAVLPLTNNTGDGRSDSDACGQTYRDLLTALRKTGMFEMIDYSRRAGMKAAVVAAVNAGESPDALQTIGDYRTADFVLSGDLRREKTHDRRIVYHHFLNLEMTDTFAGTVVWSDTATPPVKADL